jgi:POT family proton-dependent oligopeptide transporter
MCRNHNFGQLTLQQSFLGRAGSILGFQRDINKTGPTSSPVVDAFRTVMVGMKEGGLDKAKPSALEEVGHLERHEVASKPRYTDLYVSQIKSGLGACKGRDWVNLDSS